MKKSKNITLLTAISIAMAFTVSCSVVDSVTGDDNKEGDKKYYTMAKVSCLKLPCYKNEIETVPALATNNRTYIQTSYGEIKIRHAPSPSEKYDCSGIGVEIDENHETMQVVEKIMQADGCDGIGIRLHTSNPECEDYIAPPEEYRQQ